MSMLPTTFTRAQTARTYIKLREAFGLTDANPVNSPQASLAALAEIVEHANGASGFSLCEGFAWAEAVLMVRDEQAGSAPAIFDLESLTMECGSRELASWVIRLCGGVVQSDGRTYQDDGTGTPVRIVFKPDFFSEFLAAWSERA